MGRPTNASLRMKKAWKTRKKLYADNNGFRSGYKPFKKQNFFQKLWKVFE